VTTKRKIYKDWKFVFFMADEDLPKQERTAKNSLEFNLGHEVLISCQSGDFLGKLHSVDTGSNEVYLIPSVVYLPDGKQMRLETERPTTISLSCFDRGRNYSIRPLIDGYMEQIVRLSTKGNSTVGFGAGLEKA
jgi:hypothetical protein